MSRILLLLAAAAMLAADIYLYGSWTDRWAPSRELEEAAARLGRAPKEFGDWRGEKPEQELTARELDHAEIAASLFWRYRSRRTGEAVTVLLLCGRAGPMAVHTPDVCFRGAGYKLAGPEARVDLTPAGRGSPAVFRAGDFIKEGPVARSRLRIYWAWSAHGAWEAPEIPRYTFAGQPFLYKLYIVREAASAGSAGEEQRTREFLAELLPQLDAALFPSASPPGPGDAAH
jgi:hypothetical protein